MTTSTAAPSNFAPETLHFARKADSLQTGALDIERLAGSNLPENQFFERFLERIAQSTGAVAGAVWIVSAPFVMTGVYGSGFLPGATALQWLAGACIAAAISGHYRYSLIAAGHQGLEMFAMAVGSIVAVALIPIGYFNAGTAGAAAALFAAECVVLACSWLFARRNLFSRSLEKIAPAESSLTTYGPPTSPARRNAHGGGSRCGGRARNGHACGDGRRARAERRAS